MKKLTDLDVLQELGIVPETDMDDSKIIQALDLEIDLFYNDSDLKVYAENGSYLADLKRVGHNESVVF